MQTIQSHICIFCISMQNIKRKKIIYETQIKDCSVTLKAMNTQSYVFTTLQCDIKACISHMVLFLTKQLIHWFLGGFGSFPR